MGIVPGAAGRPPQPPSFWRVRLMCRPVSTAAVLAGKVFLVVAPDPRPREAMRVTGLDRTLLVFPTVADFRAWNGGPGTAAEGGDTLTCG